jgi:hypothetical protein
MFPCHEFISKPLCGCNEKLLSKLSIIIVLERSLPNKLKSLMLLSHDVCSRYNL